MHVVFSHPRWARSCRRLRHVDTNWQASAHSHPGTNAAFGIPSVNIAMRFV